MEEGLQCNSSVGQHAVRKRLGHGVKSALLHDAEEGMPISLKAVPEKLKKKSNKIKNGFGLKEY